MKSDYAIRFIPSKKNTFYKKDIIKNKINSTDF